jgi:hypothetical protein
MLYIINLQKFINKISEKIFFYPDNKIIKLLFLFFSNNLKNIKYYKFNFSIYLFLLSSFIYLFVKKLSIKITNVNIFIFSNIMTFSLIKK